MESGRYPRVETRGLCAERGRLVNLHPRHHEFQTNLKRVFAIEEYLPITSDTASVVITQHNTNGRSGAGAEELHIASGDPEALSTIHPGVEESASSRPR